MSLDDQILPFVNKRDWRGLEGFLASHPPGDNPNDRAGHAYWSVRVAMDLRDFDGALRRLDALDGEFACRCLVCSLRGEIYTLMDNPNAAIEALRSAPWGDEMDRFPALSLETMFHYCYFLAKAGRETPPKLVDAIPPDYISVQYDGKRVNKGHLLALIEQNQKRPQQPVGSL